jgi:hypothetical protein
MKTRINNYYNDISKGLKELYIKISFKSYYNYSRFSNSRRNSKLV